MSLKRVLKFQKYPTTSSFLKSWDCFIPQWESAKAGPVGSNCYWCFIFVWDTCFDNSIIYPTIGPFKITYCFIPPKWVWQSRPRVVQFCYLCFIPRQTPWGSFVFTYVLFLSQKSVWTFQKYQNQPAISAFLRFWNCLIPRGSLRKQTPLGPIVFTYVLVLSHKRVLTYKKYPTFFFIKLNCAIKLWT